LHIITNGFPEIQGIKMASGGITDYFDLIVTSENSGSKKPTRGIFDFAVETLAANRQECLMIGDNLYADIGGARNAEIDHVFYNPHCIEHQELVTFEIACLRDLKEIL
jgi:putative hydrolase of the HAD superfamily